MRAFPFLFLLPLLLSFPLAGQTDRVNYRNWEVGSSPSGKIALVIGNSKYAHKPLDHPAQNAKEISKALQAQGFKVSVNYNLDKVNMELVLQEFAREFNNYEAGLIFYAGHGFEVRERNFLIPVDANPMNEGEVPFQCVDINNIFSAINNPNRPKVIVLDACRDNPFADRWPGKTRSMYKGFNEVKQNRLFNSMIVYSTSAGQVVRDDNPFSRIFAEQIAKGGCLTEMFRATIRGVDEATGGQQTIWKNENLAYALCFGQVNQGNGSAEKADTDGDGVPDHQDQCKEVFGGGGTGCPRYTQNEWSLLLEANTGNFDVASEIKEMKMRRDPAAIGRLALAASEGHYKVSLLETRRLIKNAIAMKDPLGFLALAYVVMGDVDDEDKKAFLEIIPQNEDDYSSPEDYVEYEALSEAADQGVGIAIYMLAGLTGAHAWDTDDPGETEEQRSTLTLYEKAYAAGYREAAGEIADIYTRGHGIKRDEKEAFKWLRRYAKVSRDEYTTMDLANRYRYGIGTMRAGFRAVENYEYAIKEFDNSAARLALGEIYYNGEAGVEKNLTKAFKTFNSAGRDYNWHNTEIAQCAYRVAEMLIYGEGVAADRTAAVALLKDLSFHDYAPAKAKLKTLGEE